MSYSQLVASLLAAPHLAEAANDLVVHVQDEGLEGVLHWLLQVPDEVLVVVTQVIVVVVGLVNEKVAALPGLGKTVILSVDLDEVRLVLAGLFEDEIVGPGLVSLLGGFGLFGLQAVHFFKFGERAGGLAFY